MLYNIKSTSVQLCGRYTQHEPIQKLEEGSNEALYWLDANEMIANLYKLMAILLKNDRSDLSDTTINIKDI